MRKNQELEEKMRKVREAAAAVLNDRRWQGEQPESNSDDDDRKPEKDDNA